jgi:DME family drug/metabolite transporter
MATIGIAVGAALVLLAGGALAGRLTVELPAVSWFAVAGLGLVSTAAAFVLFLRGLAVIGPVRTAIASTAEPFFVAILAALVLDQPIRLTTMIGGSLIAVAVLLLQRRRSSG